MRANYLKRGKVKLWAMREAAVCFLFVIAESYIVKISYIVFFYKFEFSVTVNNEKLHKLSFHGETDQGQQRQ